MLIRVKALRNALKTLGSLLVLGSMLFFYTIHAQAAQVSLAWDPSPSLNVAGYKLFYRQATDSYSDSANVDVGNRTSYTLTDLPDGVYYFAVTAYDTTGIESGFSNEVCQPCASSTAPVADFSASPLTGMAPLTVNFSNNSTGTVTGTNWLWDFGDGSTSTVQNPYHTYANPKTYTVSLTATDSAGSNTKTRTGYITVSSSGPTCPCSIWDAGVTPTASATPTVVADPDTSAVELGVKFQADVNGGFITGIRFYKSTTNTGTHIGSLWDSSGNLLAQATFTGETASGWQQVNFATPVAITANTVYVASYHTNVGHYADDTGYFTATGIDNPPLHALQDGASGPNGLYRYGSGGFPTNAYQSSNYWVDVVFTTP